MASSSRTAPRDQRLGRRLLHYLEDRLFNFAEEINRIAQGHLTDPILHFSHSGHRVDEFAVSLTALDEAMTILQFGVNEGGPHPQAVGSTRRAVKRLLKIVNANFHEATDETPPVPVAGNWAAWRWGHSSCGKSSSVTVTGPCATPCPRCGPGSEPLELPTS